MSGRRRSRAKVLLPLLVVVALALASLAFLTGHGKESTDDAQVEGHVITVSARVAGQVARVLVKDNQAVRAGDVLVELDDRDLNARLAAARADVAAAKADLHSRETELGLAVKSADSNLVVARGGMVQASANRGTSKAGIEQARGEVAAAESRRSLAATDFQRIEGLFRSAAISQAQYDTARAALDQATIALDQAKARLRSAEAGLDSSAGNLESARGRLILAQSGPEQIESAQARVDLARARVAQAESAREQAELNLSYSKVRAEVAGVISRRSVEPGQMVSPDRPLLAIVGLDDTWVVANFKEDQIAEMKPGQRARLAIDAFPGRALSGHLESLAAGTGSRFSLLPPDNASGNFTKVVQRVPVLIHFDQRDGLVLRPGLSATATVFTH